MIASGQVRRGYKEALAATISDLNRCPWCVEAHTLALHATGDHATAKAIIRHEAPTLADPELQALIQWAAATRQPGATILTQPPFSAEAAPEIIGTALSFHFLNRMVSVLLAETFLPSSPRLKGAIKRTAGLIYSFAANKTYLPGAALELLPAVDLPADLAWSQANPIIAEAFARFAAATEQAGEQALSPPARAVVRQYLQQWQGQDPGLGLQWLEQAITGLEGEDRVSARLCLLTALTPYRVDAKTIAAYRTYRPGDVALVNALAWASFEASRRIGQWLQSS
jgi:AhpD family alkylhydroperoxidase